MEENHNSRRKLIDEINFHCKTSALLVVTEKGSLLLIYCPFKAIVLSEGLPYSQGEIVAVSAVKMDKNLLLVYVVNERSFYYYHFGVLLV